jgi:hypothetical protein
LRGLAREGALGRVGAHRGPAQRGDHLPGGDAVACVDGQGLDLAGHAKAQGGFALVGDQTAGAHAGAGSVGRNRERFHRNGRGRRRYGFGGLPCLALAGGEKSERNRERHSVRAS